MDFPLPRCHVPFKASSCELSVSCGRHSKMALCTIWITHVSSSSQIYIMPLAVPTVAASSRGLLKTALPQQRREVTLTLSYLLGSSGFSLVSW